MKRIAAALLLVLLGAACSSGANASRELTAPTTSSVSHPPTKACPAASLPVTSTSAERLHAGWLPPGLKLTTGETGLGSQGGVDYFKLGGSDPPFVVLDRFFSKESPSELIRPVVGTTEPIEVQGGTGAFTDSAIGPPPTLGIGWTTASGVQLEVQAHGLTKADALRVANAVQYTPGRPFTYPTHPKVMVTREQAVAALGNANGDAHAVVTSLGEFTSMRAHDANHQSSIATNVPVTQPVWVAWTIDESARPISARAVVVNAQSGAPIATLPKVDPLVLDALTDRSTAGCSPPFGVLTRSEVAYLEPPADGGRVRLKLTTEGRIIALPAFSYFGNCPVQHCDPTVPVWLMILDAPDHRYLRGGGGPRRPLEGVTGPIGASGTTTTVKPGSWEVTGFDARTGPQDTSFGNGSLSSVGSPPAGLLAQRDLAPQ